VVPSSSVDRDRGAAVAGVLKSIGLALTLMTVSSPMMAVFWLASSPVPTDDRPSKAGTRPARGCCGRSLEAVKPRLAMHTPSVTIEPAAARPAAPRRSVQVVLVQRVDVHGTPRGMVASSVLPLGRVPLPRPG
jgi:hypothetical protein